MSAYTKPVRRATAESTRTPKPHPPPRDAIRVTREGRRQEWSLEGWPAIVVAVAISIVAVAAAYGWAQ